MIDLIGGVTSFIGIAAAGNGSAGEFFAGVMGIVGSAIAAVVTWVAFGFAEHTLGMLVLIARNAARLR